MTESTDSDQARQAVRDVVLRISAAWRAERYDELETYFDERTVIAAPGFQQRVEGRAACVASFREFMKRATIRQYEEGPPTIDVWGDIAVATYRWDIAWDAGGKSSHEVGHDILVLRRNESGQPSWVVVWRTITTEPVSR